MPRVWRIIKTTLASAALDGEGARLYGGRWNSRGTPVVYAAHSESLAALELLVHLQASQLLMSYSSISIDIEDALIESVDPAKLSPYWRDYPAPSVLQAFGDRWASEQRSAVLQTPSVVIPREHIYILNPRHPDIGRLVLGRPKPFNFDPRLK